MSVALSLAADAALVFVAVRLLPSTKGYVHFVFSDYAKLTVIGVLIACAAWPVVARLSSDPRWLFFRLAIAVTLVLLLPDVYIWHQGQPVQAVAVLMVMHLAIAVITYNLLVNLAPVRPLHAAGNARNAGDAGLISARRSAPAISAVAPINAARWRRRPR